MFLILLLSINLVFAQITTFDLLISATQQWENTLNKGHEVKVAALDTSCAFNRVWHKGLLSKLMVVVFIAGLEVFFKIVQSKLL